MKLEKNTMRIFFSVISVLAVGILVGYHLNDSSVFVEGALYNASGEATTSNATTANATTANATNSNATNSNATNSNATNSNASDANARITDNIMYLYQFNLATKTATLGDRIDITLDTGGACNSGATVVFKNKATGDVFTTTVESINNNPYIVVPKDTIPGTYMVYDILLTGNNSDNTTFTKQFGYSLADNSTYAEFNIDLEINSPVVEQNSNNSQNIEKYLESISINSSTAKTGEKVYVNLKVNDGVKSVKLTFKSDTDIMIVYLKSLFNKPYFEIPTNTKNGKYKLVGATLKGEFASQIYTGINESGFIPFEFNSEITINSGNSKSYVYNNEDINSDIIHELYSSDDNKELIINASSNPIINSELFNVIKGKDKKLTINYNDNQIIFNGKDINEAKTIDASITVDKVENNEDISKLINDGLVVNFKDNGTLPGKALVKVKLNDELKSVLNNKIYVYYYDDIENSFNLIASNVKKSLDGYYQFTITHNSNYVLVNQKLDSKLVSKNNSNIVSFQKSNTLYLLLIGAGAFVIIGVVIVIVIANKNNNKKLGAHSKVQNNNKRTDKN